MQVSVTFKNINSSDALKAYVQKKLNRFDKLLDNPAEANVVFSVEKIRHITEINLTSDKLNIYATESSESMYSSIDIVVDKIKQQINKNRSMVKNRHSKYRNSVKHSEAHHEDYMDDSDTGIEEAAL